MKLGARLTETGTLETWCDSKISENRWRLQFQLRKVGGERCRRHGGPQRWSARKRWMRPANSCARRFAKGEIAPEELPSRLEAALGLGRNSWPVDVARRLADVFLEQIENRKRSAAHEVRWLNLGGFCLRPGFGYIGDELPHRAGAPHLCGGPAVRAIRRRTKSTGGSSGDAWPAG